MVLIVVKLFTGVLGKSCTEELYRKTAVLSLFFNEGSSHQDKERLLYISFLVSLDKYFRTLFLHNNSG